jgi:hypothetical protein
MDLDGILDLDDDPLEPVLLPDLLVGSAADNESPPPRSPGSSCGCHNVSGFNRSSASRDSAAGRADTGKNSVLFKEETSSHAASELMRVRLSAGTSQRC